MQYKLLINKILFQDNLLNTQNLPSESTSDKTERPQAFDLFSPIPIVEEKPKVTENIKNQPRVLSMDSGNFSVTSKPDSQNLLTMSGDALKPVVVHATSDSITTVSMNDVSNWYNGKCYCMQFIEIIFFVSSVVYGCLLLFNIKTIELLDILLTI